VRMIPQMTCERFVSICNAQFMRIRHVNRRNVSKSILIQVLGFDRGVKLFNPMMTWLEARLLRRSLLLTYTWFALGKRPAPSTGTLSSFLHVPISPKGCETYCHGRCGG